MTRIDLIYSFFYRKNIVVGYMTIAVVGFYFFCGCAEANRCVFGTGTAM
jgi:hypothetical protein